MDIKTLKCKSCSEEKPENEFSSELDKKLDKTHIRTSKCKNCRNRYNRERFHNNEELHQKKKEGERQYYRHIQNQRHQYLANVGCTDCGNKNPLVLEFDHVNPEHKIIEIAKLHNTSQRTMNEIKKCEIRCANCHRRKTAKQRGYYKYLYSKNDEERNHIQ